MADKRGELYTSSVTMVWANLRTPDEAFNTKKHAVRFIVTDELKALVADRFGISDWNKDLIAGLYSDKETNQLTLTAKTTEFTKVGKDVYEGPIVDESGNPLKDYFPAGGDVVRLKCWCSTGQSGKLSFFLSGIQVIERNSAQSGGGGWDDMSDGTPAAPEAETATTAAAAPSDDLPF